MDAPMSNLSPEDGRRFIANMGIIQTVSMLAVSAWNAIEVLISIFDRFNKFRGVYFWSMQIAAWGILLNGIPGQVRYANLASSLSVSVPFIIGWMCMVTGQAVVLWSRLHLVVTDVRHVRWVLWLIIANAFVLHIPMTVLFFLRNHNIPLGRAPYIYDRLQTVGFASQDTLLCAIYVREALRALKPVFESKGPQGRRIIYRILFVNLIGILLNLLIVVAEFQLHYFVNDVRTIVYSIKLKLEFLALTQLRDLTRTYSCTVCQGADGNVSSAADINIFDMLANSAPSQDSEAQTTPGATNNVSLTPHSARSGTYDFHEAMRQTMSTVNSDESQEGVRTRMHSTDTHSTVEMTLLERPK
ncbi:unnamed protein product [Penicillium camemberti]|uniref:Str. FM013 n=1 Tax=Penicillium camemberti (strain FM 013) TaxID=1429867 RepID=A0A0G4NTN6_PENC3|nr:unnamed protein product [Penicillium camemberti]